MHQLECICAAVSEGLPDHCILVTSGGPSSLPIIISSAYSDYSFSVEKYFLSMSSLIFLIIHLDSRLSLWQRKATQVLSSAAVLIPQTLNGWLQCLSCFSQSFNGETRECSSPWFLLIMLAALPAELWIGHFASCFSWRIWEHHQEQRTLPERQYPQCEGSVKKSSFKM